MKKRNGDMGRVSTCQKNCNTIDLRRAQVNQMGIWRKPWMKDVSKFIDICSTNSIQVLNLREFFKILFVSLKWYFWHD